MSALQIVHDAEVIADDTSAQCDADAERGVLGAVLLDASLNRGVWSQVSAIVAAKDFADPAHATIFEAMGAVVARNEPLDIITLAGELRARRRLHTIGGPQTLSELAENLATTAHATQHAELVVRAARRRRLAEIGQRLTRAALDPSRDPERTRDGATEALRALRFGRAAPSSAFTLVEDLWATFEGDEGPKALPFGIATLDRMSDGGMKRGGAYFLAARPGIGKTTLACQIAAGVATAGEIVLYVALEPSRREIISSMIAARAQVPLVKLTRHRKELTQSDMNHLAAAANVVAGWPLHVIDAASEQSPDTVGRIEAAIRALPAIPALVIVDHLLKVNPARRYERPHEGTAEVVAGLVSVGKRLGCTILTVCHIGRGVSTQGGLFRRPRPEDIAGGDAMNRDADGIILLHREDKYPTKRENVDSEVVAGIVDIFCPKLRGVEDNTFGQMRFRGDVQRFDALVQSPTDEPAPRRGDDAPSHTAAADDSDGDSPWVE